MTNSTPPQASSRTRSNVIVLAALVALIAIVIGVIVWASSAAPADGAAAPVASTAPGDSIDDGSATPSPTPSVDQWGFSPEAAAERDADYADLPFTYAEQISAVERVEETFADAEMHNVELTDAAGTCAADVTRVARSYLPTTPVGAPGHTEYPFELGRGIPVLLQIYLKSRYEVGPSGVYAAQSTIATRLGYVEGNELTLDEPLAGWVYPRDFNGSSCDLVLTGPIQLAE